MSRQWILVGAVVTGLALGAWALSRSAPEEPVAIGRPAPQYRVTRLPAGDSIAIREAYAGHVTLLNVWATWCIPCRTEMPAMERVYRDLHNRGFRIAAVSIDEDAGKGVLAFAEEMGLTFDILHDRSGFIQRTYQMVGVPQSFLIDRDGRIAWIALGGTEWDSPENRARIEKLLGGGS